VPALRPYSEADSGARRPWRLGVYSGFIDSFPMGSVMNRSLTLETGQTHVQRYLRPLLERIRRGEIDPSFVITPRKCSRSSGTSKTSA
jgi:threonine dehydrogenase-like Zn-dependent dehydrogenase